MHPLLEPAFSPSLHSGVKLLSGGTVSILRYAVDVILLSENPGSLQVLLCRLNKSGAVFGMRFASPKCKMMLSRLGRGDTELVDLEANLKTVLIRLPIWAVASLSVVV